MQGHWRAVTVSRREGNIIQIKHSDINKANALQNLLNGTATKEDVALLKVLLAIGGNVN